MDAAAETVMEGTIQTQKYVQALKFPSADAVTLYMPGLKAIN